MKYNWYVDEGPAENFPVRQVVERKLSWPVLKLARTLDHIANASMDLSYRLRYGCWIPK